MNGQELSHRFYRELVSPLLADVPHAAGRLGSGSDVLGLDDEVSRDHDWGCRLTLLVDSSLIESLEQRLEEQLPEQFSGYPVRFATSWDDRVRQRVEINTVRDFAVSRLGVIPRTAVEWLLVPGQSFLEVTAGPVFHDDSGELSELRQELQWYPHDLWLYVLACGWNRLSQELPMLARARQRGDALGAELLHGRLRRYLVHLAFLLERRWPAYPKWAGSWLVQSEFGRRFSGLELWEALDAVHQRLLQQGLVTAPAREAFYDRAAETAHPGVSQQLYDQIQDAAVRSLPPGVGSIEQWCDNPNLLMHPQKRLQAATLYLPS